MWRLQYLDRIDDVPAALWNEVAGDDYPFTRHEFLATLERTGAVSSSTGWTPQHLLVWHGRELVAVLPLYLKDHSWGEYVFDWSWADAAAQLGIDWHPKLLAAIPYTPATGPRLCIRAGEPADQVTAAVVEELRRRVRDDGLSSLHLLFPTAEACDELAAAGLAVRHGAQYHWFNQQYRDFDDFLATVSSRKRKNLRKERQRVVEQGIELRVLEGDAVTAAEWRRFHHFYQFTYARRSGHGGYLPAAFFSEIGRLLPEKVVLVLADWQGETIAGALNFRDSETLYGRYWGCIQEFDQLHFEACYYQGIDYCIRHGLLRFDPGAQGEHKIQRGFRPITTYSCHWIEHGRLRRAIDHFLAQERRHIAHYLQDAATLLPFRAPD
ncbi:MAG: GNAT family N-acetyltransferase [Spongiibacteraceae bacterium]|jgi:predicted N-acyltransferase|nr:GNAT family N-acetyltransferase [Spongiibacteraceae bacterium]